MKKIITIILVVSLFICVFSACSKKEKTDLVNFPSYHVDEEEDEPTTPTEWYKTFIDGYLEKCKNFQNNTQRLLNDNESLSYDEFLEKWNNGNGSWWKTIYSSTISFKDIYLQITPPTHVDSTYRDRIIDEGDSYISDAVNMIRTKLNFDPTSEIEDPGNEPISPFHV